MDGDSYHSAQEGLPSGLSARAPQASLSHWMESTGQHPDCPAQLPIAALDSATQAIAITDAPPNRRIVFANRALCRLTGYRHEEIVGETFRLFACSETERDATKKLADAVSEGRSSTADITCARKDGTLYRIRTHVCPITDAAGEITHWISFQKDITAEDAAFARLERITDRLETTIAATGDGVWDWDIEEGTLYCSERLRDMLGLPGTDEDALDIEAFIANTHPADRGPFLRAMRAHLTRRDELNMSLRMLHRDGHIVEVTCKGRAVFDQSGKALRVAGTISDVTALAQANRRLLRTEAIAQIGNWDLQHIAGTMNWSPETFRILGLDPERTKPSPDAFAAAFHPEDRSKLLSSLQAGESFVLDARVIHPTGATRHVQLASDATRGHDGTVIGMFGVLQDATRRREQEANLQRARKMEAFGQMAGGVAHDFNNLLAVIMGNLELLKEDPADPRLRADLIEDALTAVARGRDLTNSLLNYTHKAVLRPRRISLVDCLKDVRQLAMGSLPFGYGLQVQIDPGAELLSIDPDGLKSCLLGMILNARDAMSEPDTIQVRARALTAIAGDPRLISSDAGHVLKPGSYLEISVTDPGRGIRAEDLQRIFEPFFTTKGVGKGSGLGLSRVAGFARQSGGAVRVESKAGQGTTVSLMLPRG